MAVLENASIPIKKVATKTIITMSASVLGFLRGVLYPVIGGALYGLCQYLLNNPYLSLPVALVVTGVIGQIEHKYNIPTYQPPAGSSQAQ